MVGSALVRRFAREAGTTLVLRRNEGVSMSQGIASMRNNAPTCADQLIILADAALYRAKGEGRNRAFIHEPAIPL